MLVYFVSYLTLVSIMIVSEITFSSPDEYGDHFYGTEMSLGEKIDFYKSLVFHCVFVAFWPFLAFVTISEYGIWYGVWVYAMIGVAVSYLRQEAE